MTFIKYIVVLNLWLIVLVTPALAGNAMDSVKNLKTAAGQAGYIQSNTSPEVFIAKAINTVLSLLGVIFLVLMVYGGFMWMTARGNDQQIDKAKGIITAAIIGVVIVVSAYAITFFVISQIGGTTLQ